MIKYFVGRLGLLKERFFGLYVFGCIYASIKISDYRVDLEHMIRHFRDEFIHISPGIFEFLSNGAIKCRSSFLRYYKRICHPLIKSYIKDLKQSDAQTIHRSNVLRDGNSDSAIGKDLRYFSIIQRHKYKTILQITESMTETQLIGKKRLIGTKT